MPINIQQIILSSLQLAGTLCTITRRGAPVLVSGTTEYQRPESAVYTDIPCRRVDATTTSAESVDFAHQSVDQAVVFYLPAQWQGNSVVIQPQDDRLTFESQTYEIIRTQVPSGGSITGTQQSYVKLFTRIIE